MTDCERATSLFSSAWDDELTVGEKDRLERHFAACVPCRREYDELARTLELVQALPRPQVDDSFAHRVLAEATAREAAAASAARRRFIVPLPATWTSPSFGRPALALAATLVVAIGVGAFLLARPVSGPSPTVATSTTPDRVAAPTPSAIPPATETTVPAPDLTVARVDTPPPVTTPRREPASAMANDRVATPAPAPALAEASPLDSLFDHSADVELVLDPVKLRRERGRGYTPSSPAVKGEAASITF
jgi:hypothetical protein